MLTIKGIILFVILLSAITIVHELGHLIVAKIFGVYCKEFSIGMGPKLFGKKFNETEYNVRALLIGGFVSMAGEEDENDPDIESLNIPKERTLKGIKKLKQMLIMFAGIFMNFVIALIIYSLIILNIGSYTIASKPVIASIMDGYPASKTNLKIGDIIEKAEISKGMSIEPDSYSELTTFLSAYGEDSDWILYVDRDGEKIKFDITPKYDANEGRYIIGIQFSDIATKVIDVNILNCFKYGFIHMISMVKMIFTSLLALLKGIGLNNLSGPIGVYKVVEDSIQYGIGYYIELIALISINVAVFNALPIPAFDGGRALLLLVEVIIGKSLPGKVEKGILAASWVLIIALMLFTTFNDISRIIGG